MGQIANQMLIETIYKIMHRIKQNKEKKCVDEQMKFESSTVKLKDGRECRLIPTTPEYAEAMIDFLLAVAAETPYLLRYPDEINYTPEQERDILTKILENPKSVMMQAMVEGQPVGSCSISDIGDKRKIRHRCTLAISIKKEFWGLGIGTAMMTYLEKLAKQIGYEQIDLEYAEGNIPAQFLYEKCGYVETGRRVHALRYDDGTYRDLILMYKSLSNITKR